MIRRALCILAVLFIAPSALDADELPEDQPIVVTEDAMRVCRLGILIDGHNDLPWQIRKLANFSLDKIDLKAGWADVQTDIPRLRAGCVGGLFWAVYVPPESMNDATATAQALRQFEVIHAMIRRYPDDFELARTADDVERIHRAGKIASLIGVEGGHTIQHSLETLDKFYELGARYMGLTHSLSLDWADSATDEPRCGGLSLFGKEVIRDMNRLGMLVDLAHVSADTMRAALRESKAPVIFSHSSAYNVAQHARNVPDDVLNRIRDNGGVVMINFFSGYSHPAGARRMAGMFETERELKARYPMPDEFQKAWAEWKDEHPIPRGDAYTLVDHIDHIVQVAGIDHVGLGSDYDGAGVFPEQLDDVSGYPFLVQALLNRGYSEEDIHKIMGGNLLRVLREAERVAREWRQ